MSNIRVVGFFIAFSSIVGHCVAQQQVPLFSIPDSLIVDEGVSYSTLGAPDHKITLRDSSLSLFSHSLLEVQASWWPLLDLGNNGSAQRTVRYDYVQEAGLDLGYDEFQFYRFGLNDLRFYNHEVAYTSLYASQANSFNNSNNSAQTNSTLETTFSRNFDNGVNFNLDYRRIDERGLYRDDRSNHTQLVLNLNQHYREGKFGWFLAYIRNAFNREDNGGITNESELKDEFLQIRENLETFIADGRMRNVDDGVHLGFQWSLVNRNDRNLRLSNITSYESVKLKYYNQNFDTLSYYPIAFNVHPFGLRNSIQGDSWLNNFSIQWSGGILQHIHVGLKYEYDDYQFSGYERSLHYLTLEGKINSKIGKIFDLRSSGFFELSQDAGDFEVNGSLTFEWPGIGQLSSFMKVGLASPEEVYRRLYISNTEIWNNSFDARQYFKFGARLKIDRLGLEFIASQQLLRNHIFLDDDWNWIQNDDVLPITQLEGRSQFNIGKFHCTNAILLQEKDDKIFQIPALASRHIWFFKGRIFKNRMLLKSGIDAFIYEQDYRPSFEGIIGHWRNTETSFVGPYYQIDPFLEFLVDRFDFMIKAENFQSIWREIPVIPVSGRPNFDWMLRFSIRWRLAN